MCGKVAPIFGFHRYMRVCKHFHPVLLNNFTYFPDMEKVKKFPLAEFLWFIIYAKKCVILDMSKAVENCTLHIRNFFYWSLNIQHIRRKLVELIMFLFKKYKIMQHQISPIFVVLGPFSNLTCRESRTFWRKLWIKKILLAETFELFSCLVLAVTVPEQSQKCWGGGGFWDPSWEIGLNSVTYLSFKCALQLKSSNSNSFLKILRS